jgi:hypothetical protein
MPLRLFSKILVFFTLLATATMGQTVSVQVETKSVRPASAGYLRIFCYNDISLAGLQIPLKIGLNNDIIIDSISFQYTVATGNFLYKALVTDADREGFVNVLPNLTPISTFPAPGGEICRIYFRVTKFAVDAFVPVDTFYYPASYEELLANDALGIGLIRPSFSAGGINIRQATPVEDTNAKLPEQFSLGQNFPNPFNPATQIAFSLTRSESIRLDVYNVAGQRLTTLAEGNFPPGEHVVIWEAGAQPSGIYFYRLTTTSGVLTRKMLLIK